MLQDRQHLSDADVAAMPYRRLVVKLRHMSERMVDEHRDAWQVAAFTAWQHYQFTPMKKGKKAPSLPEYLKRFNLGADQKPDDLDPETKQRMIAAIDADQDELRNAMRKVAQERNNHGNA